MHDATTPTVDLGAPDGTVGETEGHRAVNIFLIPYNWLRHLAMALWCASFGVLAWWTVLTIFVVFSPERSDFVGGPRGTEPP